MIPRRRGTAARGWGGTSRVSVPGSLVGSGSCVGGTRSYGGSGVAAPEYLVEWGLFVCFAPYVVGARVWRDGSHVTDACFG
jgi:hypothetical protein